MCVIRNFYVPLDTRVRREVEALASAGHDVDVICLARNDELPFERAGRVTYRRLRLARKRGGAIQYLLQYLTFFALAMALVGKLHLRRRYDLVQVNSLPDFLVFAALLPRLLGARVLLDLHEPMPEFFVSKFKTRANHPMVRFIAWLEQASIRFADLAITCTHPMRDTFMARGAQPDNVDVILNGSDEAVFDPVGYPRQPDRHREFVLISHGSVEERYGLDTIIRAMAVLREEIPELRLRIYGEGAYVPTLRRLAQDLGVTGMVYFSPGYVPLPELVGAIAAADVGVVAMKRDAFRDLTLCNKLYDFITMRTPAIVSRTNAVETYFGEQCFELFEADNERDLARAIRALHAQPERRDRLVKAAAQAGEPHRWPRQRDRYLALVDRLTQRPAADTGRQPESESALAARRLV